MVYWRNCGGRRRIRYNRRAGPRLCLGAGWWRVRRMVGRYARFERRPLRGLSARLALATTANRAR